MRHRPLQCPNSVSQNADTVKVGAVVSDTRPCFRPHRVTDPILPQAVASASLQSVSLASELPYMKQASNRTWKSHFLRSCQELKLSRVCAEAASFRATNVKTHPCEEDRRPAEQHGREEFRGEAENDLT